MLDFTKCGGPYGDATSDYSVRILSGMTVMEFGRYVNDAEYGDIFVNDKKLAEYHRGKVEIIDHDLFDEVAYKPIKKAFANGGWGIMDYYISV